MTDARTPLDTALDLVLYAPVGLALTIGEELPKLAAKGRSTLTARVTTARLVGQFAYAQGRKEVERRLQPDRSPTPRPGPWGGAVSDNGGVVPGGGAVAPASPSAADPGPAIGSAVGSAVGSVTDGPEALRGGAAARRPGHDGRPSRDGAGAAGGGEAAALAIPGYDSLSASQVVQRLAGLSAAELEAVKAYEAGNRGRRTVLARIGQLQG